MYNKISNLLSDFISLQREHIFFWEFFSNAPLSLKLFLPLIEFKISKGIFGFFQVFRNTPIGVLTL